MLPGEDHRRQLPASDGGCTGHRPRAEPVAWLPTPLRGRRGEVAVRRGGVLAREPAELL